MMNITRWTNTLLAPSRGWTGGQMSLIRAILGVYLTVHFASLIPWGMEMFSSQGALPQAAHSPLMRAFPNIFHLFDGPAMVTAILFLGTGLGITLAMGIKQRLSALLLWYIWAILLGRNPLILNPGIPYVGWMLLFLAALPSTPYLSWDARKRVDPDGQWSMPRAYVAVAWIVMAVGYSYSGLMKLSSPSWTDGSAIEYVLNSPLARPTMFRQWLVQWSPLLMLMTWGTLALEIAAAPLALFSKLRKPLWFALVGLHMGILLTVDFADLTIGMLMIHLLTFDPRWLPTLKASGREVVVFDGDCGLCHGFVRFVLAEDKHREFVFAAGPQDITEVMVYRTNDKLGGADAVAYILKRLGGLWYILGTCIALCPGALKHPIYRGVARIRHRLFPIKTGACPVPPMHLRERWVTLET